MSPSPLELHRAYRRLFESTDGQTVMEDLEQRGSFLRSTFSTDPGRTALNEGRRSLVLHVKHMLDETNFINHKEITQ
ncbi:MAG: hypothetical protein KUA35_06620 [Pseudodesulfovibrio sp.]|uniref:Bbp19-like phage domain-containing protein n=1 Tax=Pseudodesulfovibrio aespoeensis (strain ATCC 700646 / DSM 10631 / Aspo-2) TaxID=643562 RepID=E6VWE0_PSEA9|nr:MULTISPECIES: hypothetical protein [Pseudodesulfovibrio]MBU4192865.1 hypothetical protein [Pseudomonadota bacterium]ADU61346.1 hypothetical protein Daes_0321 [Pseudodesulfovibrio aespoeensis Aspo-2]MBU4243180.1 hypothetical protein [Pseudomonadota bacterium]MBU4378382.1 hypothetical protein [Pseudomonadota bacterium]MBU4475627.1 hypothetical protein [Pseudomonadota bacterium]